MVKLIKKILNMKPSEVVEKIEKNAANFNFIVRKSFNMGKEFSHHDVDVDESFKFYSIMLCNPKKAYKSIFKKPIRGAILLPPKQVAVYSDNESRKTIVAYMQIEEEDIKKMLPQDEEFKKGLSDSCKKIEELIKSIS